MSTAPFVQQLENSRKYFNRSTDCLTEKDSGFRPEAGAMSVAQQVAHAAQTIDWFVDGAFGADGFDLDFSKFESGIADVTSLDDARAWLGRAFDNVINLIGSKSMEELSETLPEGPVMGGAPRIAIVGAIVEHTAHHRGALSVYSRVAGHTPAMPYEA